MRSVIPSLVSTIIPVRNRPALLADALRSVLAQTYRPIEIIIVDDGSTDSTGEVGLAFAAEYPDQVQYRRRDGGGVSLARNEGLAAAAGEFIQYLDSDDVLMPEKFEWQVRGLREHPDCGISYCYTREYPLGTAPIDQPTRRTGKVMSHLFPHLLSARVWAAPTPLYRRDVVERIGPFQDLSIYEDWEYEARAASLGVALHHCPRFLADKRDAHQQEGRRKGGVPRARLADYLLVHEQLADYARHAGVAQSHLDDFARRLFGVARRRAAQGFEEEARRALKLSLETARARLLRAQLAAYAGASNRWGWTAVGAWAERAEQSVPVRGAVMVGRWPRAFYERWCHRGSAALALTSGRPVSQWPELLADGWANRRSRRAAMR